jgi:hypothetical protein
VAAIVGVPHELERYVVAGGKYVQIVQGAVPGVAPDAAVPPVIGSPSLALHNVVKVNTVEAALSATEY